MVCTVIGNPGQSAEEDGTLLNSIFIDKLVMSWMCDKKTRNGH